MNGKNWILNFLALILTLFLIIELNHQITNKYSHNIDYIINGYLPKLKNCQYDSILLGDSLANRAFSTLEINSNILDLSTNQPLSMAGNYFILKRYLKQNKLPKNIYLFCVPEFIHNDLDQQWTYSYFETVFRKDNEIKEIKKIKPNLYTNRNAVDKYFESRKKSIMGSYTHKNTPKHSAVKINSKELYKEENFTNRSLKIREKTLQDINNIKEEIPMIYLDKIINLCKNNASEFTLIVEPMPDNIDAIFRKSEWNKYLSSKKSLKYININKFHSFAPYYFKDDGLHIKGKVNQYYQNLIDAYILDLY